MEGVGNSISSITLLVLILEGHLSTEDIESLNSVSLCCGELLWLTLLPEVSYGFWYF